MATPKGKTELVSAHILMSLLIPSWMKNTFTTQHHGGDESDETRNLEDRRDHSMNIQEIGTLEDDTGGRQESSRRRPPERMPPEFTAAYPYTLHNIGMTRRKKMAMLRDLQSHIKEAVKVQTQENTDIVIWTSTLKRKIMEHPGTMYCSVPTHGPKRQKNRYSTHQPLPGARRICYLEHHGKVLYLTRKFQKIEFQLMDQEGEDLSAAMGTVKTIDSPP